MAFHAGGNPRYGPDRGPPPMQGAQSMPGVPRLPVHGYPVPGYPVSGPGYSTAGIPRPVAYVPPQMPVPYYSTAQYPQFAPQYVPFSSVQPVAVPVPMSVPVPTAPAAAATASVRPAQLDDTFRTCNMRNSTGGYGCEPGYNYFFPAEHTKIHVLKTGSTPPWQLPANFAIQFHACHVPVNTTVAELLKGFGAKNPVPKKNCITEVCPGGGGRWYKGIELRGDDGASMKLPIKELGWDATRTGLRGEKKVVYIYVEKS